VVRLSNSADSIYTGSNGSMSHWNLYYVVPGDLSQGVIGHINLIVDPSAENDGLDNMMMANPGSMNGTSANATGTAAAASATTSTNGSAWTANVPVLYFLLIALSHISFKVLRSYA
ncbi:hypothetical protein FRC00_013283, partial [Tulasnella sp. 408]